MTGNLFRPTWTDLDSAELRLFFDRRIGGPGQYSEDPNKLYLPLAGDTCRIALTFRDKQIVVIEPSSAFDAAEWERVCHEIETSILAGPMKVGREYSFSSFRVPGSWRGTVSGVQILPPPEDAPSAAVEIAEHPFILEFPLRESSPWEVTNHRRIREHRRLTLLLNVLLVGRTSVQPLRSGHSWAFVPRSDDTHETLWVQQVFLANLGKAVIEELSPRASERLEEIDPEEYYTRIGHDGRGLSVPADLDDSICLYTQLPPTNRASLDRAAYSLDMASREWTVSVSSSFAALVAAIESLTERGEVHRFSCPVCGGNCQHEVPGPAKRFKDFLETYAPGISLRSRRDEMYSLRSGILHGGELMQLDQDVAFGWDPPWRERGLHEELWGLHDSLFAIG